MERLSRGVRNAFYLLRSYGPSSSSGFPANMQNLGSAYCKVSVRDWFRDLVSGQFDGRWRDFEIEDRLALCAVLKWDADSVLTYASLQAVVILDEGSNLEKFYAPGPPGEIPHQYYRLDYDPVNLGSLFREPLGHLHVHPTGEPRIPFQCLPSGSIVPEFVEFLYLNHFPEEWNEWAKDRWDEAYQGPATDNPWTRVTQAFNAGKLGILRDNSRHVERIRDVLRTCKRSVSLPKLPPTDAQLVGYQELYTDSQVG